MKRRTRKLDPKTLWVVTDSNQPITPPFYHEELAKAAHRELSKENESLELRQDEAGSSEAGFDDAVTILSRENRWLNMAREEKRYFQVLCEGWLTGPGANVAEQARTVAQ